MIMPSRLWRREPAAQRDEMDPFAGRGCCSAVTVLEISTACQKLRSVRGTGGYRRLLKVRFSTGEF